jgi:hypothetical protein
MATAKRFRRQAATCAILAAQTHDEESRQRYLRLEQTYLQLADTEEQQPVGPSVSIGEREQKPAA